MNKEILLPVFNIERFSIHDGPGIRTTVFLQGCPLSCRWCANPESQMIGPKLMYLKSKCIGCSGCVNICPKGASVLEDGKAKINRSKCDNCGECVPGCLGNALRISGEWRELGRIREIIMRDIDYYSATNGGVTFSGGEALIHIDKLYELLKDLKNYGIHRAVETCGYVEKEKMKKAAEVFDLFLYDVKTLNYEKFSHYTGGRLEVVLGNLKLLASYDRQKVVIRIPVIPGLNNTPEEISEILSFIKGLGLRKADLLPYHTLGITKYRQLDIDYGFEEAKALNRNDLNEYLNIGRSMDIEMSAGG